FEVGPLVSFAVMYFIFVPMSRTFYERYSSVGCRSHVAAAR
ncbi:MAG: hypothetical protein ACI9W6_001971, partial [Motiliproteus sp.]